MKTPLFILALTFLLSISIGCSNKINISGKVTFPDGEPVTFGSVCFETGTRTFSGKLNSEGRYSLGELSDNDGIPPGNYNVWISGSVLTIDVLDKEGEETGDFTVTYRVDAKYTSPSPDGLKFEVKHGGPKTFDFTVERPAPPKKK